MKKVINSVTASFREKGSKFIGYLFPVENKELFEDKLIELKSQYPDATHHCYAWRLDPVRLEEFSQDDGEPSGTAGLPILNQLKSFEAVNAGLVVVRYYGGTNLGKSGLADAYGHTAYLCLQKAKLVSIQLIKKVKIIYPYSEQNTIKQLIHQYELRELDASYREYVTLILACTMENIGDLKENLEHLSHRKIEGKFLGEDFI